MNSSLRNKRGCQVEKFRHAEGISIEDKEMQAAPLAYRWIFSVRA